MFIIYFIFCLIAMAFVSNPSSSEDNQSSTGTDLSIINTDNEKHIDTTNGKMEMEKVTTYGQIP